MLRYYSKFIVLALSIAVAGVAVAQQRSVLSNHLVVPGFMLRFARPFSSADTVKVEYKGKSYYLLRRSVVDASDVSNLKLGFNKNSGRWAISFTLERAAGHKLRAATHKGIGKVLCATIGNDAIKCATVVGTFGRHFILEFDSAALARSNYQRLTNNHRAKAVHY